MRTKSAETVKKQLFLLVIVLAAMIALLPVDVYKRQGLIRWVRLTRRHSA